ncbi:hypothetical protein OIU85_007485 [Salix viminalis]|uniref:TOG domain-containing protein n=1 Tax=Salix viminalis TaxID=40686 RepID=A0A9Q0SNP7_SALVM|nr:hypothetical protein OIU85_007485 [Salix viminalis]
MIATVNENTALDNRDQEQCISLDQGMKSMARSSGALGGRFLLESFPQPFESCFNSEEWQRHRAAVSSLSIISKNCSKTLKSKVDLVADPIMKMVDDMHHHVRWGAMYAVEELSKYLHPELQNHYHQKVLPALTKAMDDFSDSKIQVQAAMATYHFVENCTSNMLEPYLDEIISKLLRCLQQLLGHHRFLDYYRTVMPYLNFVRTKARGESNGLLLSETISFMTTIWTVIGKDKFNDDTQQVVQLLASTPISNLDIHDPMRIQGLKIPQAWGRPLQMFRPRVPALYGESDERNRMIQIKTKILEEKATACVLLRDCIAELKQGMDLWIDEVAETLVPLLNVRIAAALGN